ncbi:MAG: FHA domain-containing protein, partial [Myxococcota bacterium]
MSRDEVFETRVLEGTLDGAQVSLQVEVLSGPEKGQVHPVYSDRPFIIGSSPEASLVLTDDTVSRLHIELVRVGAKVRARDLGSTNGSFHQSAQFTELELPVGSVIRVGQTEIRFLAEDEEASIPLSDETRFGDLLGRSIEMRKVFALLERASRTDATVLVTGETGTGKEVVAESLHKV